ncbi:MAG: restriction endonuclease subunit M, partial [Deltaproteobacteria bacterium]|nr:restriction endonuclease subunit M [Deltaproteobacteria bacterium]
MAEIPLFSHDYLYSVWNNDFCDYKKSGADSKLSERLHRWVHRDAAITETQLEVQFIDLFFKETWNFWVTGEKADSDGYCLNAQYGADGSGQSDRRGAADLTLGWWGLDGVPSGPQVLAVLTNLDSSLKRRGNDRSPVKQCFDHLKYSFDAAISSSALTPAWGLVTDMNEFRLYHRVTGESACQRFVIKPINSDDLSLLDDSHEGLFLRFVFQKIFSRSMLLSKNGRSCLAKLLDGQIIRRREFEKNFYKEYQSYREFVFLEISAANQSFAEKASSKLVKLTQRFLDRCLFILYCEDMGRSLDFPNNLLRDLLIKQSMEPLFSPKFNNIWTLLKHLFRIMRDGGTFPPDHKINRFNGGLFEDLPELDCLLIPNRVFCTKGQGTTPDTITASKKTLLYLSANYNFGADGAAPERTITLYTLGRIFEQSITDLEYMEAEADSKKSIASLAKRKRDGIYYTPEWVTGYIVRETVGVKLSEIRKDLGVEFG